MHAKHHRDQSRAAFRSTMDKVPSEDKTSVLKKLEEVTKCPTCLSLLRPPLWYCVNGHSICLSCMESLTECPTCRGSQLQKEKNIVFEDVLNCLPRPCRFNGCDVFELEQNLKIHESLCSFRQVSCRLDSCSWQGKASSLLDHIASIHSKFYTFTEEGPASLANFKADNEIFQKYYVNAYNCIFIIYIKTDLTKGKLMICFVCVPTESGIVNNFHSTVTFSSKKHPDIKFQFTQKVCNEDVDIDSVFSSETCLTIPLSEMSHFIDKDKLKWSFKLFRKS